MRIEFVEIQNFRKLKSIRIDIASQTTIFVGSNNSGKTSALVALSRFLVDPSKFSTNDFTLSNWKAINKIGRDWEALTEKDDMPTNKDWIPLVPTVDVWLNVPVNEIHYVRNLIPSLDWNGGLLGVRLRYEPKEIEEFYQEYLIARKNATATMSASKKEKKKDNTFSLWPAHMGEFMSKKVNAFFSVRAYLLDPAKITPPTGGNANPQVLDEQTDFIEGNPFKGLVRIDEINAQRGFSDSTDKDDSGKKILSEQLRSYYSNHIDPVETPEPSDVEALEAIHDAQTAFDNKLMVSFKEAFNEVGTMGYPGMNDLELFLSTKIHPMDGLNHASALQYKVNPLGDPNSNPCLPEKYNGLGYQNLISMVFRLMSFRDNWMRVGKAAIKSAEGEQELEHIAPLHFVLIEEPEAHLHVQVQQVFIRKAYEILRNHSDLGSKIDLTTQLVVTTHSSHIAHECEFSWLRYFRRRPAIAKGEIPTTTVINLSEVFGKETDTEKFVIRYLRTTHCDLFFADAVILVEGPAERILVPHFIRHHFQDLYRSYVSLLEINGSHAHTLRPLIEHLGLVTLIITDIDASKSADSGHYNSLPPKRSDGQVSRNTTVGAWVPGIKPIDDLLDLNLEKKCIAIDKFSSVRCCYQIPIMVPDGAGKEIELLPNTFEDALFFQNLDVFPSLVAKTGLVKKLKTLITDGVPKASYGDKLFEFLEKASKAEFALDILYEDVEKLKVPKYIEEGLEWLQSSLKKKLQDAIVEEVEVAKEIVAEASEGDTEIVTS